MSSSGPKNWFELSDTNKSCFFNLTKKFKFKHISHVNFKLSCQKQTLILVSKCLKKQKSLKFTLCETLSITDLSTLICSINYQLNIQNQSCHVTNVKLMKFKLLSAKLIGSDKQALLMLFKNAI